MLVFIDESGDSGFKLDKGSTPVFAVALAAFSSHEEAARCDGIIRATLATLRVKPEFKFSKARDGCVTRSSRPCSAAISVSDAWLCRKS